MSPLIITLLTSDSSDNGHAHSYRRISRSLLLYSQNQ